jgi:hypothetical protein
LSKESLIGTWTGKWGRDQLACTIEINRFDGNIFYGFLNKNDARVAIVGNFRPETRMIAFKETKVIKLGNYPGWSLGTDEGVVSDDGHSIDGLGQDEGGPYYWHASR